MPEVQSPDSDTSSPDRRGSDLTEPFRLREYAPGDSLRQIHWKLSSKLDRLVIREPGMPAARTLLVFWDRSGDAAARDAQAEAVFSVCQSLSEQGYAYQLGWPEGGTARFAEAGSTEELLKNLKIIRDRRAVAILVTRFPKSPGAAYADVVLQCGSLEGPLQGGSVAARVAQLYLMDVLFHEVCRRDVQGSAETREAVAEVLSDKHI